MKIYKLVIIALFISIFSPLLMANTTAWSCGAWTKDPKGKCEEIQVCTRSVCDASGKNISNCRTETETKCANPIPATTGNTTRLGQPLVVPKPGAALAPKQQPATGKSHLSKGILEQKPVVLPAAPPKNSVVSTAIIGGGGFGATCSNNGAGTRTCSCTPPADSYDCTLLLSHCDHDNNYVNPKTGHVSIVPKVICSTTECLCTWTSKKTPRPARQTYKQKPILAPKK